MGKNQTKLSSKDFSEVLGGTKFTDQEIRDWFERFKKEFPKGKIRKPEFLVIYSRLFPDGDAGEFTDYIFRTYDQNADGVIDFREFMMTVSIAQRGSPEEKLKWAFRLYDLDGNGQLTEDEIETVLTAIYKARSQDNPRVKAREVAKEFLVNLDSNKDGFICEEEFIKEIGKCPTLKDLLQGI